MNIRAKAEAVERLRKLQEENRTQGCSGAMHEKADDVLCQLLDELGFGDVVEEYGKIHKWYA